MARWIQEVAIARSARGLAACAPCTACVTPWLVRRRVATSTAIKRDPPVRREATYARAKHSPYVNTAVSRRDPIDSSRDLTTLTRHVWTGARAGRRKTRTAARGGAMRPTCRCNAALRSPITGEQGEPHASSSRAAFWHLPVTADHRLRHCTEESGEFARRPGARAEQERRQPVHHAGHVAVEIPPRDVRQGRRRVQSRLAGESSEHSA